MKVASFFLHTSDFTTTIKVETFVNQFLKKKKNSSQPAGHGTLNYRINWDKLPLKPN